MLIWRWDKGPCAWMDLVGLDVVRDIERVYHEESGDPKDQPPAFLEEMIARGEMGVKTGKGFYTYAGAASGTPHRPSETSTSGAGKAKPATRKDFVGAWRLVAFEARAGEQITFPFGNDAAGCLIYTADGLMSVFLSRSNRAHFGSADAKV